MLKIEPIEMSIWRQRITSVIPTAATSTGAFATTSGRSCPAWKNRGADHREDQQEARKRRRHRQLAAVAGEEGWED